MSRMDQARTDAEGGKVRNAAQHQRSSGVGYQGSVTASRLVSREIQMNMRRSPNLLWPV